MYKSISAIHNGGPGDKMVLTITLKYDEAQYPNFNPEQAIKAAAADFLKTERGKKALKETYGNFNYGDFVTYVPDTICKKYGFIVGDSCVTDIITDHDESLIPDV